MKSLFRFFRAILTIASVLCVLGTVALGINLYWMNAELLPYARDILGNGEATRLQVMETLQWPFAIAVGWLFVLFILALGRVRIVRRAVFVLASLGMVFTVLNPYFISNNLTWFGFEMKGFWWLDYAYASSLGLFILDVVYRLWLEGNHRKLQDESLEEALAEANFAADGLERQNEKLQAQIDGMTQEQQQKAEREQQQYIKDLERENRELRSAGNFSAQSPVPTVPQSHESSEKAAAPAPASVATNAVEEEFLASPAGSFEQTEAKQVSAPPSTKNAQSTGEIETMQ